MAATVPEGIEVLAPADGARVVAEAGLRTRVQLGLALPPSREERRSRRAELALEPRHESERIRREDGTVRRGEDLDAVGDGGRGHARAASSNCSSSVEPFSASVEACPPLTAVAIASNQPAPTSRWWRVAVYPCSSRANSCSWRRT